MSRRFRSLYTQFQQEEYRKRVPDPDEFDLLISTSLTSAASIAESLSRAKTFLDDTSKLTSSFELIFILKDCGSSQGKRIPSPGPSVFFLRDRVAVEYDRLDILQFALANGCTCDELTCLFAARAGHLDVVQWLITSGYPCDAAAENGHLDVLQWARMIALGTTGRA